MHHRHRRIRHWLRYAAIAAAVVVAPPPHCAVAQVIELTREVPAPVLGTPTLASDLISLLEREAGELNAGATTTGDAAVRIALTAQADWRLLAAELLAIGDRQGSDASIAWLNGFKLTVNRDVMDQAFTRAVSPDPAANASFRLAAIEAMAGFSRGFADHLHNGEATNDAQTQPADSTDWLAGLLARLMPVVCGPGRPTPISHWVVDRSAAGLATEPDEPATDALAMLRGRIESVSVDDLTRDNLRLIIDFLDRGRQFAELGPRIDEYQRAMTNMLDAADALAATTWLTDDQQSAMYQRLSQAVADFADASRRQQAIAAASRLDAERRVMVVADALSKARLPDKPLREAINGIVTTADRTSGDAEAQRMLNQAAAIMQRMHAARTIDSGGGSGGGGLTRELRAIERGLQKDYRASESKALAGLASGELLAGSLADPGLASLLTDLRERVEDLERIQRIKSWSVAINQINPAAARDFDTQMRRRAQGLLEPGKRGDARLGLQRFESQLDMFQRLPFEQALRDNAPAGLTLTGGMNAALLKMIDESRSAWADAWSRADVAADAAATMLLLHRLCRNLRDAASLVEIQADVLNRWPAWQASADLIAAGQNDVVTRLRLACAAAGGNDLAAVREHLDRMDREAPLAKLAGALTHLLGSALRERADDAAGVLAQMTIEPNDDAMLLRWRAALAKICRYAAEAEHARDSGQQIVAGDCKEYLNATATRLLEQMPAP